MQILVVDDDQKITALLHRALSHQGYEVEVAHDGFQALSLVSQNRPDLIVLDILMPGLDGLRVCKRIRQESTVPILMLTAKDEISDRVVGLDTGADDYLVKPFELEELFARIRALLRRSMSPEDEVLHFADLTLDTSARRAQRNNRMFDLTATEYELLLLFMQSPRRVLPRHYIMEKVWGYDFEGESNVLEVYVGYLRQKLEADGDSRIIYTVRGVGYVLRES
ncbi:MAG: response regulator transcription factor [Chloroflexota bacterium]|nr:response regulator transcription factor [Chloroflexota bacterium]MDE2930884.1 response regulator transcription factor [Chloroflexota bacterium]